MKKLFSLLLSLLLILSLFSGCGAKNEMAAPQYTGGAMKEEAFFDYTADMNFGYAEMPEAEEMPAPEAGYESVHNNSLTVDSSVLKNAKMIYRATMEMQTLDFETSERALAELVNSCGGYFENRSISNRSSGYRYGDFTVRIPVEEYEHFCTQMSELCHLVHMSSSAENISERYYDTQSRLETANIKLDRLQSLLEKADNMADIITIESAISETEYQIEQLSGTLRHYDALVDYATVYVNLQEVYKLSGTETAPETFGDRIANAFTGGLEDALDFAEDFVVMLAGSWLFLLIFVGAIVLIARVVRRKVTKFRNKKNQLPETNEK